MNPCLFKEFVYLCGHLVDAFCPQTDQFLPLQVKLPQNSCCCLFVHNKMLVVQTYEYISKFKAGQRGELVLHSQEHTIPASKWSNSQPKVDSTNGLYFIIVLGEVYSVDLETGALLLLT